MSRGPNIAKLDRAVVDAHYGGEQADIDRAEQALLEAGGMGVDTPKRLAALVAADASEREPAAAAETDEES